ncbi:MAG: hypothetical protein CVU17_06575 [Betaproteobacteria bacterium HGW-Betaproteobacteria-11]|nr:MAG: hypothetical protein CVU17_06575 [Betaproteobacteria bacterium HGW-Betaproteobacteria-11]
MRPSQTLKLAIKASDLPVREYVRNLELKIVQLQKRNVKLECDYLAQKTEIAALKKKVAAYHKKGHVTVVINRTPITKP